MRIITNLINKPLPPIPDLIKLTLKVIYDKKRCTDQDKRDVNVFIERYYECIVRAKDTLRKKYGAPYVDSDTRPVGMKGTVIDETEFWIMWCSQRLVQDEQNTGEVARNKLNILRHNLDYRKIYQLPGSVTAKDMARAMYYLKKAQEEHPGEYQSEN